VIKFLDLNLQYRQIKPEINRALNRALNRCDFVLGQDVASFEREFADYCAGKFAIGLNSGTDALFLSLLSLGITKGDEVIVPAFTYIATAFAVTYTGARPVFVDVDEQTFNIDVNKIERAITKKTKAIIPVHLFGQCADMQPILKIARKYNLKVIEDAAQAHGASYKSRNQKAGSIGDVGCFSFYPTKNMGGFGDGGMVVTNNNKIFQKLFKLRDYGRKSRYEHTSLGYNSRLDNLQAAILRVRLRHLDSNNRLRRHYAQIYDEKLMDIKGLICPSQASYAQHVYHAYTIRVKNRIRLLEEFKKNDIGFMIYYPIPLHLQKVYRGLGYQRGDFVVAEKLSQEVLSLPMYPGLKKSQIDLVAGTIRKALGG
jgi:dTDP-4-amino-4,6-dideoxygalactose transaminase